MTIGIVGRTDNPLVVAVCEDIASDHGGIETLRMSHHTIEVICMDGSFIRSVTLPAYLRGSKFDEVWLPSFPGIDKDTFDVYVMSAVMRRPENIHYY